MNIFHLGDTESEFLAIHVADTERPQSLDPYNDWITASVTVDVSGFRNTYKASFILWEIGKLLEDLQRLSGDLHSVVAFEPLEHALEFRISPTNRGRLLVSGEARPDSVNATRLVFELDLDQSYLQKPIELLGEALHLLRGGAP
jgi:hypothetical protein